MADYQDAIEWIDSIIQRDFDTLSAPGIAIGITDSRETLSVNNYGLADFSASRPLTSQTLFQIGSISKAFTSLVLLQLVEAGRIDLDQPLTRYLPWVEIPSPYSPITLRHLLSHTAGIPMGSESSTSAYLEVWNLRHRPAAAAPGEYFHYSNTGYKALGLVLESELGKGLGEILQEWVLDPLGMADTAAVITNRIRSRLAVGYEPYADDRPLSRRGRLAPAPWFEVDTADGSISSTAADMCCYLRCLLQGGKGLISPQSFQQLTAPVIPTDDVLHGEHYGLGLCSFQIDGRRVIGHGGGMVGYTAYLLADLDADLGVVVLTNGPDDPTRISHFVLRALFASQKGSRPFPELDLAPEGFDPEEYTGSYACGTETINLSVRNGNLQLAFQGNEVTLEPRIQDVFLVPHPEFELFPLQFGRKGSPGGKGKAPVVEALHGSSHYLRSGFQEKNDYQLPEAWQAYPGHYRSYNPWLDNFRILQQKDRLVLIHQLDDEVQPLYETGPGEFRLGEDPRCPEFILFDLIWNGKAMRADLSSGIYGRTSTP